MAHNDFFQIKKQKIAGGLQVTAVADQNQNATEPALLPDEVARRAYFSYVNQGSVSGHDVQHWLEAEAQMFAENHIFPVGAGTSGGSAADASLSTAFRRATGPVAGPIALYPDPLIAEILPASTLPTQIVLADRYITGGGDPNQIDQQPWDASVQAMARYPAC
jgi:hypothetical protein